MDPNADRMIDTFERDMLKYVANWLPYGGPPQDEILPRFGIHYDDLVERVQEIASRGLRRSSDPCERAYLRRALSSINQLSVESGNSAAYDVVRFTGARSARQRRSTLLVDSKNDAMPRPQLASEDGTAPSSAATRP